MGFNKGNLFRKGRLLTNLGLLTGINQNWNVMSTFRKLFTNKCDG